MRYQLPKKLIFAISSGRSGTKHLTRILGTLPGVGAFHEPEPQFLCEMQPAQSDICIAQRFLEEKKIPALSLLKHKIFAEISHMWCKGILQAWLMRDDLLVPDVVILDRNLRSVALSLHRLDTIPERTHGGKVWCIGPSAPSAILKVKDWQHWNGYQLCYWYALEVEARKATLGNWVKSRGGRICRIDINELGKWKGIMRLVHDLELPKPRLKGIYTLMWMLNEKSNARGSKQSHRNQFTAQQLGDWEDSVNSEVYAS